MLELSALGLLQREPLHGYRLKQQLELFMSSCISVNYGAIYPLLHRLEARGDIRTLTEEAGDTGNPRKIYAITDTGRERWQHLMQAHPQDSWVKSRSRFMVKFFFFSDIDPQLRLQLIESRILACQKRQEYVTERELPEDPYQKSAWQRHLTMLDDELTWLDRQRQHARQELSPSECESA